MKKRRLPSKARPTSAVPGISGAANELIWAPVVGFSSTIVLPPTGTANSRLAGVMRSSRTSRLGRHPRARRRPVGLDMRVIAPPGGCSFVERCHHRESMRDLGRWDRQQIKENEAVGKSGGNFTATLRIETAGSDVGRIKVCKPRALRCQGWQM